MLYVKFDKNDPNLQLVPLSQGTDEQVYEQFSALLKEYKHGYDQFGYTKRFKENETYLSGDHWKLVEKTEENEPEPHTPVLWSTHENILADLVEAYPRANPEPERVANDLKAKIIADLINSARARRGYRAKWAQLMKGMIDQGVDLMEVLWNKSLYNGLGDVDFMRWSIRQVYFDPYVADINDSEGIIIPYFERERSIIGKHPEKRAQINTSNDFGIRPADLTGGIDTPAPEKESDLVFCARFFWREFTKIQTEAGSAYKYTLHWAKIGGSVVVEREKPNADGTVGSLYAHGEYPFVPYTFEDKDGSLFPLGLVDRFKKEQWFVDVMDQACLKNLMVSARTKMLVNKGAGINLDQLKDWKQDIVEGENITESGLKDFKTEPFASGPLAYSKQKIDSIKEESGENQFSRGEGGRGVTAMGAIMALQDKGAKRHRKLVNRAYVAEAKVCMLTAQLMAQFYTEPRVANITDDEGNPRQFDVTVKNFLNDKESALIDMEMRMSVEQDTGYQTTVNNQQAVELMQAQALSPRVGLELMEFPQKKKAMDLIREEEASALSQAKQIIAEQAALIEQLKGVAKNGQPGQFRPPRKSAVTG